MEEMLLGWVKESDNLRLVPHKDYEIKHDGDNFYLVKKKKEYPKTFEECCKVLGILNADLCFNADYRSFNASKEQWKKLGLMNQFYQLLICRDAYWKLYGDEMGLDGPWEPDWNIRGYYAIARSYGNVVKTSNYNCDLTFIFPTEEMRDVFYENFKELIESVKELL